MSTPTPAQTGPETPAGGHDLPVLEVYRGVAAVMVVVTHAGYTTAAGISGPWAGWLARLDFGVALFFLLSGFLLFRPFVLAAHGRRAPVEVSSYLRRRFVRIYPALLVAIVANYLLMSKAREQPGGLWVQTVFLVQNYTQDFGTQLNGLVQLWSLVVEVSFYAALPLLAWALVGLPSLVWRRSPGPGPGPARTTPAGPAAVAPAPLVETGPIRRPLDSDRPLTRRELREQEAREKSLGNRLRRVAPAASAPARVDLSARPRTAGPAPVLPSRDPATAPSDRRVALGLLTMIVGALIWRAAFIHEPSFSAKQLLWLPAFLDWFAVGMGLAWLRERPRTAPSWMRTLAAQPGVCWVMALCVYWLMTTSLAGPYDLAAASRGENLTKHIGFMVIGGLLLLPAVLGEESQGWRTVAGNRFFTWLGRISFGVFLFHPMLMETVRTLLRIDLFTGGFWVLLILTLAVSLGAGQLSWKYVEAPLQARFRNGFDLRSLQVPAPAALRRRRPDAETWGTDDAWDEADLADTSAIDLRDLAARQEAEADLVIDLRDPVPPTSPSVGVPVYARPPSSDPGAGAP